MEYTPNIRKKEEFEAFIDALEESSIPHWSDIAEAIGVNKDTITEWKKHPKAKEARIQGIQYALTQLELTGKNDWRMWLMKLKMLGMPIDSNKKEIADIEASSAAVETAELMLKIYEKLHAEDSNSTSQMTS